MSGETSAATGSKQRSTNCGKFDAVCDSELDFLPNKTVRHKPKETRKGFQLCNKVSTYLVDCSFSGAPPLSSATGIASSSEEVNSITRARFGGGDARLDKPLPLEVCAFLSALAFDLGSPAGRLCWRSAAASSSNSGVVVGDVAFRFPARSLGLTILAGGCKNTNVEGDTRRKTEDTRAYSVQGRLYLWPLVAL